MLQTKPNSGSQSVSESRTQPLVLVVDDEKSICNALSEVLEDEKFSTIRAHSGEEALKKVAEHRPEIVFLDIWMPGWDGMETLDRIKKVSPQTEVIMISGHATIANALEAIKRGALDFIEKPFNIESVANCATRALEKSRLAQNQIESSVEEKNSSTPKYPSLMFHKGMRSEALKGNNLGQRTIADSVIMYGHCLHSGMKSGLVLEPLPANSGLHFAQMGNSRPFPVYVEQVESTELATTVRAAGGSQVATIEHLMSTLHAYRISNLLIKCNGEIPIFDGSAEEFCRVIDSVGVEEQEGDWFEIAVDEKVVYSNGREEITIEPADNFIVHYELEYPAPIGKQVYTFELDGIDSYKREIAPARTFGLMKDAEKLQKAGLAAGARLDNFILIGDDQVVNTELRFDDEFVRHKILDVIGDIFLIGRPIRGKITARMTGHSDNIELLRKIQTLLEK